MKNSTEKLICTLTQHTQALATYSLAVLTLTTACIIAPPTVWAQYSPPTSGLIAWWRGDGNANDSADSHNGTLLGGMGFTTGVYNQAFAAGSTKRVYVPDSPAFQLTSLSMGAWINVSDLGYAVMFRGDDRPGLDPYVMGIDPNQGGQFEFSITGTSSASAFIATPIPYHQWVQVTSTFDASTGTMRIYTNGTLAAQGVTSILPILALTGGSPGIDIGNVDPSNDFPFQGAIDEAVLYNRALSPSEVLSLVPEPGSGTLLSLAAGLFWVISRRRRVGSISYAAHRTP